MSNLEACANELEAKQVKPLWNALDEAKMEMEKKLESSDKVRIICNWLNLFLIVF